MAYHVPAAGRVFVGFVDAGVVAVNRSRKAAKAVLQRQRDAARRMVLELGQADEHIRILESAVQVVSRVHVGVGRDLEARVALALAEGVGVLELHARGCRLERAHVPARIEHGFFERPGRGPRALDKPNPARAGLPQMVRHPSHHLGMHIVGESRRKALEAYRGRPRHVELHGDGFTAHQVPQPA